MSLLLNCVSCRGACVLDSGFLVCQECGFVQKRVLDTRILSYNTIVDAPSTYTRTYRFKCLLNELNGVVSFSDELGKIMLENHPKLSSPKAVKEVLLKYKKLKKYSSKIPAILIWNRMMKAPLADSDIPFLCSSFQVLDREISLHSGKKPAFTYLLPVVLRICNHRTLADSSLLRKPSKLILKKYLECTRGALIRLGYRAEDALESTG